MTLVERKHHSRRIQVGAVAIGGGAPIVVQSMTNTDTRDRQATVRQIQRLEEAGCEIIRVALPDNEAVEQWPQIKKAIGIPIIGDIHFDHRLALGALRNGVDGTCGSTRATSAERIKYARWCGWRVNVASRFASG